VSVREFFLNWLTGKQLSKKDTTARRYKKAIEEFVDSLGPKADKSIVALTPADVEHFRDVRTKQGAKSNERDVFSPGDVHALLGAASPEWKTAILVGYYVGPRLSDVVSLTWRASTWLKERLFILKARLGGRSRCRFIPTWSNTCSRLPATVRAAFCVQRLGRPKSADGVDYLSSLRP
jgi:integrase